MAILTRSKESKKESKKEKHLHARDFQTGLSTSKTATRRSLKDAIKRFKNLEKVLLSGDIDEHLLRDLRGAVNRVRNTAWGVQQYIGQKEMGQDPGNLLTILAGERIRTTYTLCLSISSDLKRPEIDFQPGTLVELHEALRKLAIEVNAVLEKARSANHY